MEHTEKSMKNVMGSHLTNIPSKPSRRRASPQAHLVTDAGREIAHAFQMNRSPTPPCITEKLEAEDVKYCYYLLEDMPLPGPTWSTTGPSVLAEPPSAPPIEACLGLEWVENQASSPYTWWQGFLEGLDDCGNVTNEKLDIPFVENIVMENSKGLSHEPKLVDAIDIGCCPDDWLVIQGMEQDLGDMP